MSTLMSQWKIKIAVAVVAIGLLGVGGPSFQGASFTPVGHKDGHDQPPGCEKAEGDYDEHPEKKGCDKHKDPKCCPKPMRPGCQCKPKCKCKPPTTPGDNCCGVA